MEGQVLKLMTDYGLDAVVIALAINVLTGVSKLPLKAVSRKMEDGSKLTKYLVFLPLAWGFLLTLAYVKLHTGTVIWDKTFATLWLTSGSLSLTLYAMFEKLFPSKEKILKEYEIESNRKLIEELKILTGAENLPPEAKEKSETKVPAAEREAVVEVNGREEKAVNTEKGKTIILRGKSD